MKRLSFDSLNDCARCGFRPWARQMGATAVALVPKCAARVRVLQCVAPTGVGSNFVRTTFSSLTDVRVVRGRLGRARPLRPECAHANVPPPADP